MPDNQGWDEVVDVVVVGTGAGGMTSALLARDGGAEVLVVEKGEFIGGTTAVSGGDMWIPCNHHVKDKDTREEAIAYVTRLSDGRAADPELIAQYVDTGNTALEYLEANTEYKSVPHVALDDYYSVVPGRIPGTKEFPRTVSAKAYDVVGRLGEEGAKKINLGPWVSPVELAYGEQLDTGKPVGMPIFYEGQSFTYISVEERDKRRREGWRGKGGGLIAPLYRALLDRDVEVRTSFPAKKLIINDEGAVIGVVAGPDGAEKRIGARRGVVLAAGGFEWNPEMVKTFLGYEVKPVTPWTNTGDGHQMAMAVGAKLGHMNGFFSYGVMYDPWELGRDGNPLPQMQMSLGAGSIIVNRRGKRFMHGGYTYNDFSHPFNQFDQRDPGYPNKGPGWCVFGAPTFGSPLLFGAQLKTDDNGSVSVVGPKGQPAPDWIVAANTIAELAEKMGIDPIALEETVTRYNKYAENGEDPDWKDPQQIRALTGPDNVNIKPIEGPFGAIQQWPGTIGTNGGLRIDKNAQVLGYASPLIDGLYAAGNTSSSVLGATYPGGGSCVGPSMVTGFWAGSHLGKKAARDIG